MKLNLKQWALIAEVSSAVAVVASLVFVGFEVRQSNNLAESEAIIDLGKSMNELQISLARDVALSELLVKAYGGQEDLTASEKYRFDAWTLGWLNVYDSAWLAHDRGVLTFTTHEEYMAAACRFMAEEPLVVDVWTRYKKDFGRGFVQYVDESCNLP